MTDLEQRAYETATLQGGLGHNVSRYVKRVTGENSWTRFVWQGMNFEPGEDAWIRPTVLFGDSSYMTDTDSGTNLVSGLLQVDVFTAPGYGMSEADDYVSAARLLFDRVDITVAGHGDLEFGPSGPPRPGPFDGSWLHTIVECPFTIVENK